MVNLCGHLVVKHSHSAGRVACLTSSKLSLLSCKMGIIRGRGLLGGLNEIALDLASVNVLAIVSLRDL